MAIVSLAFVCLSALVVAGRPVHLPSTDFSASSAFRNTVQAAFQLPGKDVEYLSESIAVVASFEMVHENDTPLDDIIDAQEVFDIDNELDDSQGGDTDELVASDFMMEERQEAPTGRFQYTTAPIVVLAFSCVAAFLALACITLTLYLIRALRSSIHKKPELLPWFWRHPKTSVVQKNKGLTTKECLLRGRPPLLLTEVGQQHAHGAKQGLIEMLDASHVEDESDTVSGIESQSDDIDGGYQDALDMTPIPHTHDLQFEKQHSCFDGPPLPSLRIHPPDSLTNDRGIPLTRELCSSPVSRPAWSARAMDSPALGITSREGGNIDSTLLSPVHSPRRAYRSAVPEFEIALAMQLRPGLGIGADSAWIVRFLMVIFGWFAVALTGNTL